MPFITTSTGAVLHYEEHGSGETVVAIHGLLGTARVDLGALIDTLKESHHVIGVTLRGYGESGPKPRTFPPDFYGRDAQDVLALIEALNLQRVHLIGYSDGGEVALIAATQQPSLIASVAVWGSVGIVPAGLRPDPKQLGTVPGVVDIQAVAQQLHGIHDPEAAVAQWIQSYTSIIDRGGDLSLSQAHRLTMPVLVIVGDDDAMAPVADASALVNAAPRAQLKVFRGGHALHEEHPVTLVASLRQFWQQTAMDQS